MLYEKNNRVCILLVFWLIIILNQIDIFAGLYFIRGNNAQCNVDFVNINE